MIWPRRRHDPNVSGGLYGLTVLTPIVAGREQALREHLEGLDKGPGSPLARLPARHFARWVIIPGLPYEGPPQRRDVLRSQQLLFASTFDGPRDHYMDRLCACIPDEVDAIWGKCSGYPGPLRENAEGVKRYLCRNQVATSLFFVAYSHVTVDQVQERLERRERLRRFVTRAPDDPLELQAAFRREFPPDWRPVGPCPDPLARP